MAFGARTGAGWVGMRSAYVRGQQSGHGTVWRRGRRIRVGIVDGHVRRTGTPEVDKMNENDIFTTAYFTATSVSVDFNYFVSTWQFRRVIITNEVGLARTRGTNF